MFSFGFLFLDPRPTWAAHGLLVRLPLSTPMPAYDVVVLAANTAGSREKLVGLLRNCATKLWSRGAVITEVRSWGIRDLAYRIRQRGVNHYRAHYLTLDLFCSPASLSELESTLRTSPLVLRWMPLRKRDAGRVSPEEAQARRDAARARDGEDAATALEEAKYEYRNLVMQRVFEGKTRQEMLAEQLSQHRFASYQRTAEERRSTRRPSPATLRLPHSCRAARRPTAYRPTSPRSAPPESARRRRRHRRSRPRESRDGRCGLGTGGGALSG